MQQTMPKRITITLPNPVYDRLTALSEVRDKPPATIAAECVERLIEQVVEAGEIPPPDQRGDDK